MAGGEQPVIVWLRRDLRLEDNAALSAAAATGLPVIPVYVWDTELQSPYSTAGIAGAWTLQNAGALGHSLREKLGSRLVVRTGDPAKEVLRLAQDTGAAQVHANSLHEPAADEADRRLAKGAGRLGVNLILHSGGLLMEPGTVTTQSGGPYKVFTPFYREFLRRYQSVPPGPAPRVLKLPDSWPGSNDVEKLLRRVHPHDPSVCKHWTPGEQAGRGKLAGFISAGLAGYASHHDMLAPLSTSAISPYLQCGAINSRQVWDEILDQLGSDQERLSESISAFQRQLVWREFAYHLLAHYPQLADQPYREEFRNFQWQPAAEQADSWREGRTGYPVVDAAMRQLNREGWMPGRVRMVVASFLIKHLLQNWTSGEEWFRERLIDYDPALNAFNWQWVAGCGFDAAPYFRIFNPIIQGKKFDPEGAYVRQYVPELAALPAKYIHNPWAAPAAMLREHGIIIGDHYPLPVVEHSQARHRALAAYYGMREQSLPDN